MYLSHITPEVDSCAGLIIREARKYYNRISHAHQRWLDPEDLIQEALLAAVSEVNVTYDATRGKYSTYLYTGLRNSLSRVCLSLLQQKRQAPLTEVDAPLSSDSERTLQLPDPTLPEDQILDAVQSFTDLCIGLSAASVIFLTRGFLLNSCTASGRRPQDEASVLAEIRLRAGQKRTDPEAFRVLLRSEKAQKMALHALAECDIIDLGHDMDVRVLECTECRGSFPLAAIRGGRFVAQTMTCVSCYSGLQQSTLACFGKQYDPAAIECRVHCRDRHVCKLVSQPGVVNITSEDKIMAKAATATAPEVEDELADVDLSDVEKAPAEEETPDPAKTTAKKTTAKKAAPKPAATKKAAKPSAPPKEKDEDAPPEEIGPRWPFKKNSIRGYAFQRAFKGCKTADLKKEVEDLGWDFGLVLRNLQRAPHTSASKNTSHTWKLSEEGGRLRVYDVKYMGGKKK